MRGEKLNRLSEVGDDGALDFGTKEIEVGEKAEVKTEFGLDLIDLVDALGFEGRLFHSLIIEEEKN